MVETSFNNQPKFKSAILNENKPTFTEKSQTHFPYYQEYKRNNRYHEKNRENDLQINLSLSKSRQSKTPIKSHQNNRKIAYSIEKEKTPVKIAKFENIFQKNKIYLFKNKSNYKETLKKLNLAEKNHSPSIKVRDVDENSMFSLMRVKKQGNYEEGLEKIENLYRKNDQAIRDYIRIKESLNLVCLV